MNAIIVTLMVLTVAELPLCHFTLWYIIAVVGRIIFSTRMFGATVKIKYSCMLEGIALAMMFLWNALFAKGHMPWLRLLLFLLFALACAACEFLDDMLYVYITDEDDDTDTYDNAPKKIVAPSKKKKVKSKSKTKRSHK